MLAQVRAAAPASRQGAVSNAAIRPSRQFRSAAQQGKTPTSGVGASHRHRRARRSTPVDDARSVVSPLARAPVTRPTPPPVVPLYRAKSAGDVAARKVRPAPEARER